MLTRAIGAAGFKHEEMAISLDIAASEFGSGGRYRLRLESRELDTAGMIDMLGKWMDAYPIVSVEDPLAEDDEAGLVEFTRRFGRKLQIIGDDYLVTSAERVRHAAAAGACNCALIKLNQAGTVTETRAALDAAKGAGWNTVVSGAFRAKPRMSPSPTSRSAGMPGN